MRPRRSRVVPFRSGPQSLAFPHTPSLAVFLCCSIAPAWRKANPRLPAPGKQRHCYAASLRSLKPKAKRCHRGSVIRRPRSIRCSATVLRAIRCSSLTAPLRKALLRRPHWGCEVLADLLRTKVFRRGVKPTNVRNATHPHESASCVQLAKATPLASLPSASIGIGSNFVSTRTKRMQLSRCGAGAIYPAPTTNKHAGNPMPF